MKTIEDYTIGDLQKLITNHDKLVEALDAMVGIMDNIQDSEGLSVDEIYALLEATEALKQAKGGE